MPAEWCFYSRDVVDGECCMPTGEEGAAGAEGMVLAGMDGMGGGGKPYPTPVGLAGSSPRESSSQTVLCSVGGQA